MAKEKYDVSQEALAIYTQGLLTFKGTMKVDCVVGIKQNQVRVIETSCLCAACCQKENDKSQMCWTEHLLKKDTYDKTTISNDDKDKDKEEPCNDQEISGSCNTDVSIDEGDFVAAVYRFNSNTYVGKVIRYDEDDAFVSFMVPSRRKIEVKTSFQWPANEDKIWVSRGDICMSFPALHPCHHIQSKANHHLALTKARSSQYKNYKENKARNIDEVYYEIYVTSLKSDY